MDKKLSINPATDKPNPDYVPPNRVVEHESNWPYVNEEEDDDLDDIDEWDGIDEDDDDWNQTILKQPLHVGGNTVPWWVK